MTEESIHGQRNIGVEIQLGAQAGQTARKQPVCTIIGTAKRETTTARSLAGIHREGQTSYHSTDSSYRTLHSCQHLMAQTVAKVEGMKEDVSKDNVFYVLLDGCAGMFRCKRGLN